MERVDLSPIIWKWLFFERLKVCVAVAAAPDRVCAVLGLPLLLVLGSWSSGEAVPLLLLCCKFSQPQEPLGAGALQGLGTEPGPSFVPAHGGRGSWRWMRLETKPAAVAARPITQHSWPWCSHNSPGASRNITFLPKNIWFSSLLIKPSLVSYIFHKTTAASSWLWIYVLSMCTYKHTVLRILHFWVLKEARTNSVKSNTEIKP